MKTIPMLLAVLALAFGAVSCGSRGERCGKCGMFVEEHPRWVAGMTHGQGEAHQFCSPRCMMATLRGEPGAGWSDAWVTEYYTQERMPIEEVLFVMGSDLTGPMGQALVPIRGREEAEQFASDHQGKRVLEVEEVTMALLKEIMAMGKASLGR